MEFGRSHGSFAVLVELLAGFVGIKVGIRVVGLELLLPGIPRLVHKVGVTFAACCRVAPYIRVIFVRSELGGSVLV